MRLEPFKLERYFAKYEFTARHLLCSSDCESLSVAELISLEPDLERRLLSLRLGYTEPRGSPSLRHAIRRLYRDIGADEVLVHSGAEEAIFNFMNAMFVPGDSIIVQSPCYQSLAEVARGIGCTVTPWKARPEDWGLDLKELEGLIQKRTRAIVINSPHNPTGHLFSGAELRSICRMAEEHDLLLLSDEVYRGSEHDPTDRLPAACDLSPNAVSLGVMSKTYGLAGLRIGWVATHDEEVLARMERLKDYTTICNSAPSELMAEAALNHADQVAARNVAIIKSNLAQLDRFFSRRRQQFGWVRPQAGPIAYPLWKDGDVDEFCRELVDSAGVLLLPGSVFDDPSPHFRIGFGRRNLPEALAELEGFLDR